MMLLVGPALVIEIVQQRRDAPERYIGALFASVGAHAGFHGQRVLAQTFRLRVLAQKIPGILTRRHSFSSSQATKLTAKLLARDSLYGRFRGIHVPYFSRCTSDEQTLATCTEGQAKGWRRHCFRSGKNVANRLKILL